MPSAPKRRDSQTARQLAFDPAVLDLPYAEALASVERLEDARHRKHAKRLIDAVHDLKTVPAAPLDLSFLHSGLCQCSLPHKAPKRKDTIWTRRSGAFTLMITPGAIGAPGAEAKFVGLPFGSKARLIMFHLQSEGLRSRTVSLGKNLSAYLRSLGLEVKGGDRGTIGPVREQALRIGRCSFTMQWDGADRMVIQDTKIVDGMELWKATSPDRWCGEVHLSAEFHEHLRAHAVPLDKRGIAMLSQNSLSLDLYALFAYRLPKLTAPLTLTWEQLQSQIGSEDSAKELARRVRLVLPSVLRAYPDAKVEVLPGTPRRPGVLVLHHSPPAVAKTVVQGLRLAPEPPSV